VSVVDLCAGTGHWLAGTEFKKTAVEANEKYRDELMANGYEWVLMHDVTKVYVGPHDACVWIDGIEHLPYPEALSVLRSVEARVKVMIVFTPEEFHDNKASAEHLGEPLQEHKSCFPRGFWFQRGYKLVLETYDKSDEVHNNLYVRGGING